MRESDGTSRSNPFRSTNVVLDPRHRRNANNRDFLADHIPLPCRCTTCGPLLELSVTTSVSVCRPLEVGENFTPIWQRMPRVRFAPQTQVPFN
jgi:hypothetical protein